MSKLNNFVCYSQINLPDLITVLRNTQGEAKTIDGNKRLAGALQLATELLAMSEAASAELGQIAGSAPVPS